MRLPLRAFLTGFLCLSVSGAAWAQFDQYTTPGGPAGRPEDARARLAREVAAARYHLGPVRIAPWLGWRDVAYVKSLVGNAGDAGTGHPAPADLTATVGAGLKLYLPVSSKITWTAYALPEYVWWRKLTERRRLDERFGAGFHAFGTRLTVEVTADRDEQQRILSPEVPRLVNAREDHGAATVELGLTRRFSVYASGTALRQESLLPAQDPDAPLFQILDHREQVIRGGVRWRPVTGIVLGVGTEHSRTDFLDRRPGEPDRSNSGTAPFVEALYDHDRIFANLDLAARSLEAAQGSDFVRYHRVTGQASVAYKTGAGPELFLYGHRNLVYAIDPQFPYLDEQRLGLSLHLRLGRRARGSVYGEGGTDGFTASRLAPAGTADRRDDVTSFGGSLSIDLGRTASLALTGVRSRFRSNLPGDDRTFTSLGVTVALVGKPAP